MVHLFNSDVVGTKKPSQSMLGISAGVQATNDMHSLAQSAKHSIFDKILRLSEGKRDMCMCGNVMTSSSTVYLGIKQDCGNLKH